MKKWILAIGLATLPLTSLQAMTVGLFLEKADALQRRGAMALLSSDLRLLKNEIKQAGAAVRIEEAAARRAGRQPPFCIPEQAKTEASEILTFFRRIPVADRGRLEVRDGFRQFVRSKYPCR